MVSMLDYESSFLDSSPGKGHCMMFLSETLSSPSLVKEEMLVYLRLGPPHVFLTDCQHQEPIAVLQDHFFKKSPFGDL